MADIEELAVAAAEKLGLEPLGGDVRNVRESDLAVLTSTVDLTSLVTLRAFLTSSTSAVGTITAATIGVLGLAGTLVVSAWQPTDDTVALTLFLGAIFFVIGGALGTIIAAGRLVREGNRIAKWIYLLDRRIAELDGASASNIVNSPGANSRGTINLSLWGRPAASATVEP